MSTTGSLTEAAGVLPPSDSRLRFSGHWDVTPGAAITVNSGSRLCFEFVGTAAAATFRIEDISHPPRLSVCADRGRRQTVEVNAPMLPLTPRGMANGRHTVEVVVKDVDERANRWVPPFSSAVVLTGLRLARGNRLLAPTVSNRPLLEFYGDSITQGVRIISDASGPDGSDATQSYPYLTAARLRAEHRQGGFGRQGILAEGNGGVPAAAGSFGWNFFGSPAIGRPPDIVVVNQGTNDPAVPEFEIGYRSYLDKIRTAYPHCWILALRPFGGYHADAIRAAVNGCADSRIRYLDTDGWVDSENYTDRLHPNAAGHREVTGRLVPIVRDLLETTHRSTEPA